MSLNVLAPDPLKLNASSRAKLFLALAAWLARYDGVFEFENIGDSYLDSNVPYIAMRSLPALFGILVPPLVFATMRASGSSLLAAGLATALVLLGKSARFPCRRIVS